MLKLLPSKTDKFHNFKCGEIYCETPTNYNVCCCLCGEKIPFDEFRQHFQNQHLLDDDQLEINKSSNIFADTEIVEEMIPPSSDNKTTIKSESDEEEAPAIASEICQLEDEKPIDLMDIQLSEQDEDRKNIVVLENFTMEHANEDNTWKSNNYSMEKERGDDNEDIFEHDALDASSEDDSDEDDDSNSEEAAKPTDELKFPCTNCSRSYKLKRSLLNHIRIKHKNGHKVRPKTHKCEECGEVFRSERILRSHKWKHTGIFCDICGQPFTQVGNMMRHRVRHTGIKAHKCNECDNSFYTSKELKAHMMRHTGHLPIICEICGRRCRDHGVLTAHMRRHTGERPAKCEVCGKCFYSVYDLNVHSVTHSNERPFSCDVCGSTFQTKKALRVHKKLHSSERKHECKVCGKSFLQSGGLYSHMKTHDAAEGI